MRGLQGLATLEDLKHLGDYCDFDFEKKVEGDFTSMYAVVMKGRLKLLWLVKPVGGTRRMDVKALSFYIMAREGFVGLLYKTRTNDNRYRIVFFDEPLRKFPRLSRKMR